MNRRTAISTLALAAAPAIAGPVGFKLPGIAWTPKSPGNLIWWVDASQITGASNGDSLETWTDASASGWNLTQSTSSKRPTYQTGQINGKPVVRFDGVDDFMSNGSFAASQPCTYFAVVKRTGGNPSYGFVFDNPADPNRQSLVYTVGSTKWTIYAGSLVDESGTTGAVFKSIQAVFNGASSKIIVGGTSTTVNPGSQNASGGITMGALTTGSGFEFGGDVAEIGCYSSLLSDGDLAQLQAYLNAKYGL